MHPHGVGPDGPGQGHRHALELRVEFDAGHVDPVPVRVRHGGGDDVDLEGVADDAVGGAPALERDVHRAREGPALQIGSETQVVPEGSQRVGEAVAVASVTEVAGEVGVGHGVSVGSDR